MKILLTIFVLFFSSSVIAENVILYCNLDTHVKFRNKNWEDLDKRKFQITIKDEWIQVYNLTAEIEVGEFYVITNTTNYINAILDESDEDSWIKMFALTKLMDTRSCSLQIMLERLHLGWCLNDNLENPSIKISALITQNPSILPKHYK